MIINRMDRKRVTLTVTATEGDGSSVLLTSVDYAVLRPYRRPTGATVWKSAALSGNAVSFFLSGPDAEELGDVIIPTGGGDVWIRVIQSDESDHKFVERVELR